MNEIQIARLLDQARSFVQEEKHLHAIQVYRRLLHGEPGFILPYLELASVFAELDQHIAAIRLLQTADMSITKSDEIVFMLGTLHSHIEQYDRAITYFKLLGKNKLPQVHFHMGVAYFYKGAFPSAEEQFRLTLKYDPHFPKINEFLGELLIKRKSYTEAILYLEKGIDADPYSAVNHFLLGIAYNYLYDWKKAYNEFVIAVDMDPQEPQNWQLCGETLIQLKRFDEAEPYLRKALELYPQSIDALLALSKVFLMKGDNDRAGEYLQKAHTINPVVARAGESRWRLRRIQKRRTEQ